MPPHLHPRSRTTSSLFATTLLASFLVVALPHILPCPVPRTKYADGDIVVDQDGRRRRWRQRGSEQPQEDSQNPNPNHDHIPNDDYNSTPKHHHHNSINHIRGHDRTRPAGPDGQGLVHFDQVKAVRLGDERRECPVPKPGGALGQWLGFTTTHRTSGGGGRGGDL